MTGEALRDLVSENSPWNSEKPSWTALLEVRIVADAERWWLVMWIGSCPCSAAEADGASCAEAERKTIIEEEGPKLEVLALLDRLEGWLER